MNDNPSNETPNRGPFELQLYVPRRILIAKFSGAPAAGGDVKFRLDVPDMRLHWRFDVVGSASLGIPAAALLSGRGLRIWVAALAEDEVRGAFSTPTTDIEGTNTAKTAFPANTSLGGYSLENPGSGAVAIQGVVHIPIQGGGPAGALYVQAAFQPKVGHFYQPWEWQQIKAGCGLSLVDGVVDT